MSLDLYHKICYLNLSQPRYLTFTSVTVNLGAVIYCPSDNQLEYLVEIASCAWPKHDIYVSPWMTAGGLQGDLLEDGRTRYYYFLPLVLSF